MLGIYLLVTLVTQLAPYNLYASLGSAEPAAVSIDFVKLNGLRVGSPVLVEGRPAGSVSRIDVHACANGSADTSCYRVEAKIVPREQHSLLKGTVALITSPLTPEHPRFETVVELLVPKRQVFAKIEKSECLVGYSSFAEFWASDLNTTLFEETSRG